MREMSPTMQLTKTKDYAAYTLFAVSAPSVNAPSKTVTLDEYLSTVASRNKPHSIGVSINQRFGQSDQFFARFKRQCEQTSPTFERARAGLIENGRARGWVLAAVEVEPAELRFHYASNAQWRKHRTEIDKYRSAHPEEAAKMTDEAIVAALGLAPYHETLVFHSPNPVLAAGQNTVFEFHVARDDGTGHDTYTVKVRAYDIIVIEPVGLAQQQLIIPNEADPANYAATIISIQ